MPLGLLISDAEGCICYANRAAERLLHYAPSALLADSVTVQTICPSLVDAHTGLANQTLSTEPFEATCKLLDAATIDVLLGVAFLNPEASVSQRQLAIFIADLTLGLGEVVHDYLAAK